MDCGADARIGRAPADVAAHGLVDVGIFWFWILFQERRRRHDLAGLAIAALRNLQIDPGGLHGFRRFAADAFDRSDVLTLHGGERRHAGACRLALDVYGAGAALRDAASKFCSV